jgi:hypothetical protein
MLCASDAHVHGADHPTWQQTGSKIRDDYRKAAAWLLPRLTVAATPAGPAPAPDRAAVLLWAADQIDAGWFTTAASATAELRRLAGEAPVTPPPALTEEGRLRAQVEVLQQDAERDRGLAKVGARCMREGHQGLIEQGRAVIEGHRFALSVKLGLGTGAPWDAIHERVAELAGEAKQDEATTVDLATLASALDGLHTLIATSSRDWQTYRVDAWIWAVICGWDCEQAEHDDTCTHGALEETASMQGWDTATVAKARRYRAAVRTLTEARQDPTQDGEEA